MDKKMPIGNKGDGSRYKVLLVDDSIFILKQLKQIFQSENFEVVDTADNGKDAIEKYKELFPKVDLVTLDITMPEIDGIAVLEQILKFDPKAKVVMVSALGKEELVKKSLIIGAKNYIIKPLDRNKVLDRIESILTGVKNES